MTSASKVGDLFTAAGEAFAKLAEITQVLQVAAKNDKDESHWLASDTESLQMAVKRFGDDLNIISEHIKDKTMCQIKVTFRKIQPTLSSNANNEKSNGETSLAATTTFGGHSSVSAYQSSSTVTGSSSASAIEKNANSSNTSTTAAGGSNNFSQPTSTSGGANSVNAAATCPSPSPFLHYPLLRKSADITLNMLNARDDSDEDERKSMSVFNSV